MLSPHAKPLSRWAQLAFSKKSIPEVWYHQEVLPSVELPVRFACLLPKSHEHPSLGNSGNQEISDDRANKFFTVNL